LLDSVSYPQDFPFFIRLLRIPVLNKAALAFLPDKTSTKIVLNAAFFDTSKISDEMVNMYASYLRLEGSHHALIATADQIVPPDMASVIQKYKSINIPVLLIWGEQDKVIPVVHGRRLFEDIPTAQLQTIDACGHIPQEECPERTIDLIENFLVAGKRAQ
jgi:pimeloyl-ACP methyl ester carboxylesterase